MLFVRFFFFFFFFTFFFFDLCLFGFVGFLFLLVSGKGCGLLLWHSLDVSVTLFFKKTKYTFSGVE